MTEKIKRILLQLFVLLFIFSIILYITDIEEGFFETIHQKTVYLIWRNKTKDTNHGFGDKLRGAIYLYQHCKKNNLNFKIDGTNDICSKFLKNIVSPDYDTIKNKELTNLINIEGDAIMKDLFILNNTIYVYSNTWPIDELNADDKLFGRFICEPTDELKTELKAKLEKIPEKFGIQHFRFNDVVFKEDVTSVNPTFQKYFSLLSQTIQPTDILFTNSNNFKKYAKDHFHIKTIDCDGEFCKVQHIGESTDHESVKNSFIEFCILTKAKYIKSYSCYEWPSGFVYWPAKIYDIPIETTYIDEESL